MINYCKRCLYSSNHPLGITFNEEGICSGCIVHEEKNTIDWQEKWEDLKKIVDTYRSKKGNYDCIIPVTGAKDTYFITHVVVNLLKLNPLAVNYNKYFNTKVGIDNLSNLRNNPEIVKKITRSSMYDYGSMFWPCLAGETVFPVQTAVAQKIPLIIWGAHQGLEQVGQFSHYQNVEMTRRYRKEHDLFGCEETDLITPFNDITEGDLLNYVYPSFSNIQSVGVRGIYLGNFIRWDPYAQHIEMVKKYGYKGQFFSRSFDAYDHADSFTYLGIHDLLKMFKHGYGKVTDQACREIRHGRLNKSSALELVNYYQHQDPQWLELFCSWLNIDLESLVKAINKHRNPTYWDEIEPHVWKWKQNSALNIEEPQLPISYPNVEKILGNEKFINIGRGVDWPDSEKN